MEWPGGRRGGRVWAVMSAEKYHRECVGGIFVDDLGFVHVALIFNIDSSINLAKWRDGEIRD